jgi:hypothetical protein
MNLVVVQVVHCEASSQERTPTKKDICYNEIGLSAQKDIDNILCLITNTIERAYVIT